MARIRASSIVAATLALAACAPRAASEAPTATALPSVPASTSPPAMTDEPSASASASAPASSGWMALTAEPIPFLHDVTEREGAYLGVGMATRSTDSAPIPAVWRSADGVTWEEEPYELSAGAGGVVESLSRVVTTDTGFAGLGSPWFGVAMSDDGTTWTYESLGDGACPAAIASRDEVLVAVGSIGPCGMGGGPGTPAVWIRDADGWTLLDAPAAAGAFTGVVATPDGFSAWGTVTAGADGWICEIGCRPDPSLEPYAGAPWSSADGRTWRRASDPTPFAGATIDAIVATDAQTAALGSISSADGASGQVALWTSSTGDDWTRVESELPFGNVDPAVGRGIGAGGDVLAVWVRHFGPVAAVTFWTSADPSEWEATEIVADLRGISTLNAGLIAYGTVPESAAGAGGECSKDEVLAGTCRNVAAAWVYLPPP